IPYSGGIIAPPEMAIISRADAVFVNFPRPVKAKGQMAGHTKALAIPKAATNSTDTNPFVKTIHNEKTIPNRALAFNAVAWLIYLGIKTTPKAYVATIAINVYKAKYLTCSIGISRAIPYAIMVSTAMTSTPTYKNKANTPNHKYGN